MFGRFAARKGMKRMKNSIDQKEFAAIVAGILDADPNVQSYSVTDKGVTLSVCASVRREKVNAFLDFDDHGEITGRFSYAQSEADAQSPREIGSRISDEIQNMRKL